MQKGLLNKYKTYKKIKVSEYRLKMKDLLHDYPQCLTQIERWRKWVSKTSLDPDRFKEVLNKSKELPPKYNRLGYVKNQLLKHKKPPQYVETLFGKEKVK